jgi:hypothetical protein
VAVASAAIGAIVSGGLATAADPVGASLRPVPVVQFVMSSTRDMGTDKGDSIRISSFSQRFLSATCIAITITKPLDRTSGLLAAAAMTQQVFPAITLFVPDPGGAPETLRYVFRDTVISRSEITTLDHGVIETLEFYPTKNASVEIELAGGESGDSSSQMRCTDLDDTRVARGGDSLADIRDPARLVPRLGW